MIDIESYLLKLDKNLIADEAERKKIDTSIGFLKEKLWGLFQDRLRVINVFGSYEKETFITIDEEADVDVMIVFKDKEYQPQTYLNQIQAFLEKNYNRSTIFPDHPTVAIEMDHIKFEIVPAIFVSSTEVKIPAPRGKELKWISTAPSTSKAKLTAKDNGNRQLIRPVIRIIKYLNYLEKKPFLPYTIEQRVVNKLYECKTLRDYFFSAIQSLFDIATTEEQKKFVVKVKEQLRRLKALESNKLNEYIEMELCAFLPIK